MLYIKKKNNKIINKILEKVASTITDSIKISYTN